jgi:hypothetical protein
MKIDANMEYELLTKRLVIKVLNTSFAEHCLHYYQENRDFFQKSIPTLPEEYFATDYQKARFWQEYDRMLDDRQIRFYLFLV